MIAPSPRTPLLVPATLLAGAALLAACGGPEGPPTGERALPTAALRYLSPERITTSVLADGVVYRAVRSGEEPWDLHLVEADAARCEVGFQVLRPEEGEERVPVSELVRRAVAGEALAAVNGDFFTEENRPIGVEVAGGARRGRVPRPVFAWRPGELPWVGPIEWEGDSLRVGDWILSATEPDGGFEIVAGFPALLTGGRWVGDLEQEDRPGFASTRHPRTAVGWDPARSKVWLVVVDGRRSGSAEGMTLPELAELFQALGATEALNLDGGGSSVMVVGGRAVNRPSNRGGERPVVNALLVRQDSTLCRVARAE